MAYLIVQHSRMLNCAHNRMIVHSWNGMLFITKEHSPRFATASLICICYFVLDTLLICAWRWTQIQAWDKNIMLDQMNLSIFYSTYGSDIWSLVHWSFQISSLYILLHKRTLHVCTCSCVHQLLHCAFLVHVLYCIKVLSSADSENLLNEHKVLVRIFTCVVSMSEMISQITLLYFPPYSLFSS